MITKSDQEEIVLAAMSTEETREFTPAQMQKMMFLIDEEIGEKIGGRHFDFEPDDYGPFDKEVYFRLNDLERDGLAKEEDKGNVRRYFLTEEGYEAGKEILEDFDEDVRDYIDKVSTWVRDQSFRSLVASIYAEYPRMKENSVFNY